ncbi:hypothetical protein HPP92_002171 [Vanilla planifolia]|uniref:Uncharacterized protein n=1 Tax=Vanilla planifolia TaxID=51239 RepID=A0A835S138_VANPL|nr:hypothetical protein HPP92_002171 [Vanilla planifolia]
MFYLLLLTKNVDIPDENICNFFPDGGHNHGFLDETESVKNFSFLKRKAVPGGGVNDSPAKRRDRRRKLVKVLQSSAKQSVSYPFHPHSCSPVNQICGVDYQIGISHIAHQSPDSDDTLNISRQTLEYSPIDTGSGDHMQQLISNESTQSTWTEENDFDSSATDSDLELGEGRLRTGGAHFFQQMAENSIDNGISQWHLKGKRKT